MGCLAQNTQRVMLPGKGNINVEQLNQPVNLEQDISQLNLTELRVLRNSLRVHVVVRLTDDGTLGTG